MDETSTFFEDFPAFTGTAAAEAADEDDVDGVVAGGDGAAVGILRLSLQKASQSDGLNQPHHNHVHKL